MGSELSNIPPFCYSPPVAWRSQAAPGNQRASRTVPRHRHHALPWRLGGLGGGGQRKNGHANAEMQERKSTLPEVHPISC